MAFVAVAATLVKSKETKTKQKTQKKLPTTLASKNILALEEFFQSWSYISFPHFCLAFDKMIETQRRASKEWLKVAIQKLRSQTFPLHSPSKIPS